MIFEITFIIASLFQTYIFYLFGACFYREKVETKRVLGGCAIFFVITTSAYLIFSMPFLNLLSALLCGFCMLYISYRGRVSKAVLVSVLTMCMMGVSETVLAVCIGAVSESAIQQSGYYNSVFVALLLPMIQYVIVMLVRNFLSLKDDTSMPISYWVITVVLPLITLAFIIILYTEAALTLTYLVICGVLLIAINFMTIYLYDNTIRNMQARKEKEILEVQNLCQQKQAESMHNVMEQIRGERHDFYKHLSSLRQMLAQGQYPTAQKYVDELCEERNAISAKIIADTGNYILDSILNYEYERAKAYDIEICYDCEIPKELELSPKDMSIILMNLLDNAIEAVRKEEEKKITCKIVYRKPQLLIRVTNPCTGETGTVGKTTKKNAVEHGYGLKNVQKAVDQYLGTMKVKKKNSEFDVKIGLNL
ncbi:MAG TPA: hypothetical protein DEO89_10895 [Lachnospiraceae bacterium]|nr:hypothetical protein [Lachnospiraceae bacterium]